jgi:hypothetical protein
MTVVFRMNGVDDARGGRTQKHPTAGDFPDRPDQLLGGLGLHHVPSDACSKRRDDLVLIRVNGQQNLMSLRTALLDLLGGLDAVQFGHGQVENGDVGEESLSQSDGLLAILGLTDHLESFPLEESSDTSKDGWNIVSQQNPLRHLPLFLFRLSRHCRRLPDPFAGTH